MNRFVERRKTIDAVQFLGVASMDAVIRMVGNVRSFSYDTKERTLHITKNDGDEFSVKEWDYLVYADSSRNVIVKSQLEFEYQYEPLDDRPALRFGGGLDSPVFGLDIGPGRNLQAIAKQADAAVTPVVKEPSNG